MTDLTMPKLSEAMEEGTILRWLKADGETVGADDELVEIETDKATVTHAAEASGALQIVVPEGTTVPVGAVIARIGEPATAPPDRQDPDPGEPASEPADPLESPTAAAGDVPTPPPALSAPAAAAPPANGNTPAAGPSTAATATPLARRIARERGLDLERLSGSGPRGRITRADVLAATGELVAAPPASTPGIPPTTPPSSPPDRAADFEIQEPTRVQRLIARRMAEAKATIPDFEVATDAVMDHALAMRAQLKQLEQEAPVPSVNDLIVKACAIALRHHPRVNASYLDGRFKLHRQVNVGVAVAAEDALIVPVVRDADVKSLGVIAEETRALALRARTGKIAPPDLAGGTFTVSNLGMFGMTSIRPVINPPQVAILGVGAIREVLARDAGEIVERTLMTLTLSADHRILYGADAAQFLAEVKALLEAPVGLVL
jgi:pyruvate dehydrogenase E2 component (dihydrolipoyllysine-residue acetyltransferase)